jgi:hypothetical protein
MTPPSLRQPSTEGKSQFARPFAKLPHDIAADPRLLAIDVRLLLALVYYAMDKTTCWPSDKTLGARIGRARATVQRRLRHLETIGLIVRQKTDANPTGRVLVLAWRIRETPPVASKAPPPGSPVRHEAEPERRSFAPPGEGRSQGQEPLTREALEVRYTESGWLGRPQGDPLRRLAERRLAALDPAARGCPHEVVPVFMTAATSGSRRSPGGGWKGPRPLFG